MKYNIFHYIYYYNIIVYTCSYCNASFLFDKCIILCAAYMIPEPSKEAEFISINSNC